MWVQVSSCLPKHFWKKASKIFAYTRYFTYFYIIKLKDMRVIQKFKCSLTGDECVIIADQNGDEMCILKEDYEIMYPEKSWKKASKRFA